jgi:hypothetical protein
MKKVAYFNYIAVFLAFMVFSCTGPSDIRGYEEVTDYPEIFPDYRDVVVPPNIAPLNFDIKEEGKKYFVSISSENFKTVNIISKSSVIRFKEKIWRKLLTSNKGEQIKINIYVLGEDRKWARYKQFAIEVANEDIDDYLAYRLINVGYVLWEKMAIYQRDLTSFKEKPIIHNRNTGENCMNCHSFCNNDPERVMFHMRKKYSGTVVAVGDSLFKLNLKTPYTMSAGVYPAWHPDGKHIAFSVDIVRQFFHAIEKRNEVYDRASDLIIYDIKTNTVTTSPKVSTKRRETLPTWSPDGRFLYYCSAPGLSDTLSNDEVKYDLLRISYDTKNNQWGEVDTVLLSSEIGSSISFPKISPDGRYLMFCHASHGYFTIYDATSDLYILDLQTGEYCPYPFNSDCEDSYHSWSSNGRWFVFSSKRLNGLCTKPYISYFDSEGKSHKPFLLPQKDPKFYYSFVLNYNVPELVKSAVLINRNKLLEIATGDPINVSFDKSVQIDALSGATRFNEL